MDLTGLTPPQLLVLHAKLADELRARGITRSSNNPTGDLAEYLFCRAFGWKQADNSQPNVDAVGPDGTRYQIKGRRITRFNKSRQLSAIIDDSLVTATPGVFVTILFGPGAVGFAVAPPRTGYGTELWLVPSAGNGGGQTTLHGRFDVAFHPLGFAFTGASVAGVSPVQAELALAANWSRAYSQRKSVPLAFLISN